MGSERDSQLYFPEVHDELMKSWKAHFTRMIKRKNYWNVTFASRVSLTVCKSNVTGEISGSDDTGCFKYPFKYP